MKSLTVQRLSGPLKGPDTRKEEVSPAGKWEVFEETALQEYQRHVMAGPCIYYNIWNVYELTGLTLQLVFQPQPSVMVLRNGATYKLVVDGFDEPLLCRRLVRKRLRHQRLRLLTELSLESTVSSPAGRPRQS